MTGGVPVINGIMNIYKEAGYTSHDVVAKLRGIVRQKKIGHTGTLDPDAVGVLPVCFGNATKLCDMMTDRTKEYEAVMRLGITTDTQDMGGKVIAEAGADVDAGDVERAVMGFVGGYEQVPPMYSALKINGKKLYELAREGKEVVRQPRHVDILFIKILDISLPEVRFAVGCSKGTYIRTLCADIGEKLGCGAAMARLTRTRVGNFKIEDSIPLSKVEELARSGAYGGYMLKPDSVFMEHGSAVVRRGAESLLLNGNRLGFDQLDFEGGADFKDGGKLRVYGTDMEFKAVYAFDKGEGAFRPWKMFL